jgi:hypothetical protein
MLFQFLKCSGSKLFIARPRLPEDGIEFGVRGR